LRPLCIREHRVTHKQYYLQNKSALALCLIKLVGRATIVRITSDTLCQLSQHTRSPVAMEPPFVERRSRPASFFAGGERSQASRCNSLCVFTEDYYYYYYRKKRFRWRNVKRLQGHLTNAKTVTKRECDAKWEQSICQMRS